MIAIDTNVLVRWIAQDDPAQSQAAVRLVDRALAEDDALFVSVVVVVETVWVLAKRYDYGRREIADVIETLLSVDQLEIEHSADVARAIQAYRSGRAGLADYLIRERGLTYGAKALATFDRNLQSEPGCIDPDPDTWGDAMTVREEAPAWGARSRRRVRRS